MSDLCQDVFGKVSLVSGLVRPSRLKVGTCSAWSGLLRDLFGEVVLMSGRV